MNIPTNVEVVGKQDTVSTRCETDAEMNTQHETPDKVVSEMRIRFAIALVATLAPIVLGVVFMSIDDKYPELTKFLALSTVATVTAVIFWTSRRPR